MLHRNIRLIVKARLAADRMVGRRVGGIWCVCV